MGDSVFFLVEVIRSYFFSTALIIGAIATVIQVNRMQSIYQKSLAKKVNKIKELQNTYINEKNKNKLPQIEKQHAKAVKSLENRIKRVMFFNRNIIITNNDLINEVNLALPNQPSFTFNSKLDEMIKSFNEKHKRFKTINAPKKGKTIDVEETTEKIVVEKLEEDEKLVTRTLTEEETKNLEIVRKTIKNNNSSIYKDQTDDRTL